MQERGESTQKVGKAASQQGHRSIHGVHPSEQLLACFDPGWVVLVSDIQSPSKASREIMKHNSLVTLRRYYWTDR